MLESLTIETFRGREQERFYVTVGEAQLEMQLAEVTSHGVINLPPAIASTLARRQEAFSLVFHGPGEPLLHQGMYAMRHGEMGELGTIFIVPIDRDTEGHYYYQAVFN